MTFHSGNQGTATINGVELPVTAWSTTPAVDIIRFANSKTGGFRKKEATYKDADFTIEVDYDFDANPFAVAPGLTVGTVVTNIKLFLRGSPIGAPTAQPYWNFPSAIVTTTPQRLENEGKITTSFSFTADGTFSPPA